MAGIPRYLNTISVGKNLKPFVVRTAMTMILIRDELGGFPDDIERKLSIKTGIDEHAIKQALGRLRKLHIWRNNDLDMDMLELVCRTKFRFIQVIPEVGFNHPAIRAEKARLAIGDIRPGDKSGEMVALRLKHVQRNWCGSASSTLQDHMEKEIIGMIDDEILVASMSAHELAKETLWALRGGVLHTYSAGFTVRPE